MNPACAHSFKDLFEAAFQRPATPEEIEQFRQLSQAEKNTKVREWAKLADWNCSDELGTDHQVYAAFWPKWGKRVF